MSSFNINQPPGNIPDRVNWLTEGQQILFGRTTALQNSGGGSGAITIGSAVSGGGANRVLYENGSQNLAATNNFRFINSTLLLGEVGGDKGSVTLNGSTSGAVTLSVGNAAGTYVMYLPNAQGAANTTLVNDGSGGLSWDKPVAVDYIDIVGDAATKIFTKTVAAGYSSITGVQLYTAHDPTTVGDPALAQCAYAQLSGTTATFFIWDPVYFEPVKSGTWRFYFNLNK